MSRKKVMSEILNDQIRECLPLLDSMIDGYITQGDGSFFLEGKPAKTGIVTNKMLRAYVHSCMQKGVLMLIGRAPTGQLMYGYRPVGGKHTIEYNDDLTEGQQADEDAAMLMGDPDWID